MELLSVPVNDVRTDEQVELVLLDRKTELRYLSSSDGKTPKVMSVDTVVKALFGILQTIVLTLVSWLLVTVVNHSGRITKNETILEQQRGRDTEILNELRQLNKSLGTALQNQASFKTDIANLKEEVKTLSVKVNGK